MGLTNFSDVLCISERLQDTQFSKRPHIFLFTRWQLNNTYEFHCDNFPRINISTNTFDVKYVYIVINLH